MATMQIGSGDAPEPAPSPVPSAPSAVRRATTRMRKRVRFVIHARDELDTLLEVPRGRSRLVLSGLLSVAICLAFAILSDDPPAPVLTEKDFAPELGIRAVLARYPSLFVEVDGEVWRGYGEASQAGSSSASRRWPPPMDSAACSCATWTIECSGAGGKVSERDRSRRRKPETPASMSVSTVATTRT